MHRPNAAQLILLSQICLYGFLAICTALLPHYLFERNEGGVSNFGVHARTIVPYSLGLGLGGVLLVIAGFVAARPSKQQRQFRIVLRTLGILLLIALASTYPYKLSNFFGIIHIAAFQLLFAAQLLGGAWITLFIYKNALGRFFLGLQLLGFAFGVLTLFGVLHVLFVAQMLSGMAFGYLIVKSAYLLQ